MKVACLAPAGSQGSQVPWASAPVVVARAPDPGLADPGKALVTLRLAAADVGGIPGPASPYTGPPLSPVLLGPGGNSVIPHLALAEVDGIQESSLAVLEVTPGLAFADAGGTLGTAPAVFGGALGPAPTVFGGTPGLALAVAGETLGPAPAVFGGSPGLALADTGGTLGPILAVFAGTPSLHTAAVWVIPGLSPADVGETPGRVAAHSE